MKKILIIGFVLIAGLTFAQKEAMYAHYTYNLMSVNPAYAGLENKLTAILLHRSQWVMFPGAPRFETAAIHGPIGKNVGLGFSFVNEQIGPESTVSIKGDYSYTIRSEEKLKIVFGLKAALNMMSINLIDLELDNPYDPAFYNNKQSIFLPNFGFGVMAYTKDYYVGFSIPDLIVHNYENNTIFSTSKLLVSSKHYYLIGGALLPVSQTLVLKPSAYIRLSKSATVEKLIDMEADISMIVEYKNLFHGGISLRTGNSISALMGLRILPDLELAYSFDLLYTNPFEKYNGGSHEVVLKYSMFMKQKRHGIPCPTFQ